MSKQKLSAVEAELYDRQIRLWGIESQEKLRAANVLLIGIRGLGSEIAKNILLAGINSLTILDDGVVTNEDYLKNFFLNKDSVGKNIAEEVLSKAQALNPLVKINIDTSNVSQKDQKFFEGFTIIVATQSNTDLLLKLDKICCANKIKLIAGDVFGMFGFSVADFQEHDFFEDQVQLVGKKRTHDGGQKKTVKVQGVISYPKFNKVFIFPNSKQSKQCVKKSKRRNIFFYLLLTLMEFRNKNGRNPEISTKEEDLKALVNIKQSIMDFFEVEPTKLDDSVFELIFGEVVPTCAVLGGVIAQEVIKAVSHKEATINNIFLFDPITCNGKEETVGA